MHIPLGLFSRIVPKNSLAIPANTIHICHVKFHVIFSSIKNVMDCSSKLPSSKPKTGGRDTLNQ